MNNTLIHSPLQAEIPAMEKETARAKACRGGKVSAIINMNITNKEANIPCVLYGVMDSMICHDDRKSGQMIWSFLQRNPLAKVLVFSAAPGLERLLQEAARSHMEIWDEKDRSAFWETRERPLPSQAYDAIILDGFLETAEKPQELLKYLRPGLKDSGQVLSAWKETDRLDAYVARLFMGAGFTDLQIQAEDGMWLVFACQFESDALKLRSRLDTSNRCRLGRLARRVEHGIDASSACGEILRICKEHRLDGDYLFRFVQRTALRPELVYGPLLRRMEESDE